MPIRTKDGLKLTYQDYLQLPEDGRRHEIIDGDHYVSASPGTYHQQVSTRLFIQLYRQINEAGRGEVFYAPVDLVLSDIDVVVPDLLVLLTPHLPRIDEKKINGPVDLAVEILSPSTRRRDRGLKRQVYERSRVAEYWIVDPKAQAVEQFVLREGRYEALGAQREEIVFQQLAEVRVDLTKVW